LEDGHDGGCVVVVGGEFSEVEVVVEVAEVERCGLLVARKATWRLSTIRLV
jgi:hypothetical protein